MSTTRSTSDHSAAGAAAGASYTVVGGGRWDRIRKYPYEITFLVLGRGDRPFRGQLLRDLESRGLGEVLWAERPGRSPDGEQLAKDFPRVRFLRVNSPCSDGELVDIGIAEARSPLVFCTWSDSRPLAFPRDLCGHLRGLAAACVLPVIRGRDRDPIPSWQSPGGRRRGFAPRYRPARETGEKSLFPFDYCGVYDREKFSQVGGFDPALENPYWQKLDFGLRCWLWGERIVGTTKLTVTYSGAPPADDTTPDRSYKLFYLRNLAVAIRGQAGVLPWLRLAEYMLRSDTGPLYAVREFSEARDWVRSRRYRFRRDPRDLAQSWETI